MDTGLHDEIFLARLGVLCAEVPSSAVLEQTYRGVPAAMAPAQTDLEQFAGNDVEIVTWVGVLARLWANAAQENLLGLAALFNTPARNHPPRALLRAALEHSSRAWWVLGGADAKARGARAWLARWVALSDEAYIAKGDDGRTGAMQSAPERLANLESRILELFEEVPVRARRPKDHALAGEMYGSLTSVTTEAAEAVLRAASDAADAKVPAGALYPSLSALLHPTVTAILAYARREGDQLSFPAWEPTFVFGATLTMLAIWRGVFQDLLDYFGWEHPDLAEWSDHLDVAIAMHTQQVSQSLDSEGSE